MTKITPYTAEETRQHMYAQMRSLAEYWATAQLVPGHTGLATVKDRMDGLCFSILNMFDGTGSLPALDIRINPHEDDKSYCISQGERWYEPGMLVNPVMLHEEWFSAKGPKDFEPITPENK